MSSDNVRLLAIFALATFLAVTPAAAQGGAGGAQDTAAEAAKKAEEQKKAEAAKKKEAAEREAEARKNAALLQGSFRAEVLAGDTVNDFRIAQPANRLSEVTVTVSWQDPTGYKICPTPLPGPVTLPAASKAPDRGDTAKTTIGVFIPPPPCLWPLRQQANITIKAGIEGIQNPKPIFEGSLPVSAFWFPFIVTLIVLGGVYPGSAAASWYASVKQYKKRVREAKEDEDVGPAPKFWASLDPVELTKNPYGRGSIAKLQIYTFSFIVFGLLLFNVLRTGLLINMSKDILYLMGISAAGAAGGKIAYVASRRLCLDNWAWLRRMGWLEPGKDVAPHARWSELFVDSNTKEFDPYRFQMAVFSLVVAVALVSASATGLEAFTVPPEMLALLGISQVVFIGGQAMEDGGYKELDEKLTDVQKLAKSYQALKAKADVAKAEAVKAAAAGTTPAKTEAEKTADLELQKYNTALALAAEMFAAIYSEQIGANLPPTLTAARNGTAPPP